MALKHVGTSYTSKGRSKLQPPSSYSKWHYLTAVLHNVQAAKRVNSSRCTWKKAYSVSQFRYHAGYSAAHVDLHSLTWHAAVATQADASVSLPYLQAC